MKVRAEGEFHASIISLFYHSSNEDATDSRYSCERFHVVGGTIF